MIRTVTLTELFEHPITKKYVKRSGLAHAIATAQHAFKLSEKYKVNPDLATKAAFLHDIGHYTWYKRNGDWDFQSYQENDIHAIKGAERAHKLLIRLGEEPSSAKQIALAILLHTDSYLPEGNLQLDPLQKVVALADAADEEPNGNHHYRDISFDLARKKLQLLDQLVEEALKKNQLQRTV